MPAVSYYCVKNETVTVARKRQRTYGKDIIMTEQVLRTLFDFQKFARNQKLDAMLEKTRSHFSQSLSEDELAYVNAAGVPEMMRYSSREQDDKDNQWNQY